MDFLRQYLPLSAYPPQNTVNDLPESYEATFIQKMFSFYYAMLPPIHAAELFKYGNQYELLSLVVLPIICGYMGTHLLFKNLVPFTMFCLKVAIAFFCALWIRFYFTHEQNVIFTWFL
jgi:hypothetical protein